MARREAERRMREVVTVGEERMVRPPGGFDAERVLTPVYEGRARVKFPSASAYAASPAGQQVAITNIVLSVPSGSPVFPPGLVVRVDSSADDPALVGRRFRIKGPAQAGQTTAHRYPVTEES
ncbi:DUF6093 family protein [Leucobacter albus]|uniref:DUF6093 family protein n=1 Tax=Leucobacter albus TaxID=272210 RepID=A0ABW3TQN6_9MICO